MTERTKNVLRGVALVLLVCAVFGVTATFEFVNYDDDLYAANPLVDTWSSWSVRDKALTPFIGYAVPLPMALWALLKSVAEDYPAACHLLNVLVHAVNVVLLLVLLRTMTRSRVAWLAAGFFAFHPLVVEPVAWVTGLKELLVTMGFLLAAIGTCRVLREMRLGYLLTVGGCAIAFASKPTAVVLGPLLITTVLALCWKPDQSLSRCRGLLALGLALTGAGLLHALATFSEHARFGGQGASAPVHERFIAAIALQLEHLLVPLGLKVHYAYQAPGAREYLLFIVVLAVVLATIVLGRKTRLLWVGLLWLGATYLPYSGIAQQSRFTADSYMYLPLVGVAILLAAAVLQLPERWKRLVSGGGVAFVLFCVPISFVEVWDWSDSGGTLWLEARGAEPQNPFYAMKQGQALYQHGDFPAAIGAFESVDTAAYGRSLPFPARYPMAYCQLGELGRCNELFVDGIQRLRANPNPSTTAQRELEFLEENYRRLRAHYEQHNSVAPNSP